MPTHRRHSPVRHRQSTIGENVPPHKTTHQATYKSTKIPSPPRTPPQGPLRVRTARHSSTIRQVIPDTFLDDLTPVEGNARGFDNGDYAEDPHDLSLSPRHATRASILDNMLLSLDQFSSPSFSASDAAPTVTDYYTPEPAAFRHHTYSSQSRNRGHTFSSSLSSDQDFRAEDRHTTHGGRGRRSNSSSNFQTVLKRIPSVRGNEEPSQRSKVYSAQRAAPRAERVGKAHTRGKGSKSSASSSIDLGQMMAGTHINSSKRRSSSFDLGANFQRYLATQSFENDPADVTAYTAQRIQQLIDAAPEPVIPAGPRRAESPMRSPRIAQVPSHVETSGTRTMGRRNSAKSSKTMSSKKGTLGTTTIRSQDDELRRLRDLPPIPAASATNNGLSTHHSHTSLVSHRQPVTATSSSEQIPLVKEKTGFLRRVFGGSSRNLNSHTAASHRETHLPTSSQPQDNDHTQRQPQQPSGSSHGTLHRSKESGNGQLNGSKDAPVITKRPSSFFRRRKKSVTELAPVPPLPIVGSLEPGDILPPQASPVSSLRQVLDPYLADLSTPTKARQTENEQKGSNMEKAEPLKLVGEGAKVSGQPALAVPERNVKNRRTGLGVEVGDDSFLADSSGNEDASPSASPQHPLRSDSSRSEDLSLGKLYEKRIRPSTMHSSPVNKEPLHSPTLHGEQHMQRPHTNAGGIPRESEVGRERGISDLAPHHNRVWLGADSSEEQLGQTRLSLPIEGAKPLPHESNSDLSSFKSVKSTLPISRDTPTAKLPSSPHIALFEASLDASAEQSNAAMEKALEIFNDKDEDHEQVGAWLGEIDPERELVRLAFMSLFDWSGQNILYALRGMCSRIALKGESQQVDRIIDAFSRRWCECNPNNGFKSPDVVHTITYSILLLNTDLHMADIEQKMTKTQFIRNTLHTVRNIVHDNEMSAVETVRTGTWHRPEGSNRDSILPTIHSPTSAGDTSKGKSSLDVSRSPAAGNVRPTDRLAREDSTESEVVGGPLVTYPFKGPNRAWENQIEVVLKSFYQSIARERLPLFGAPVEVAEPNASSNHFLGISSTLRRTPSVLSRAQSEHTRGRGPESRTTGRWTSKGRSRPRLYPMGTMGSTRTSFDDQSSVWTPSINSSTWSKTSFGKTLTSMSVESFGSAFPGAEYQKSIGFANALSQAIIREDAVNSSAGSEDGMKEAPLLEDESLELAGAPWAKEGLLHHKHHLDGVDKRTKDRNWSQCFAVIEKGWMRLFSFDMNAKTIRQRAKTLGKSSALGPVGGGNWMDNAEEIAVWQLRHTMASALPPPGYSKQRPHVWALSLPNGAVHLFEVGTPDIVKEFVSTANYWSARMSKEPLFGGISNMEFGWSDNAINRALINNPSSSDSNNPPPPTSTSQSQYQPRPSIQSSIRSSLDHHNPRRGTLPADHLKIVEWTPPQPPLLRSTLMEVDQLRQLSNYVKNVEEELSKHNELRPAMLLAYSPRSSNRERAMGNWERKSSWLLREIVRVGTYVEALKRAEQRKEELYSERRELDERIRALEEEAAKDDDDEDDHDTTITAATAAAITNNDDDDDDEYHTPITG